jgi:hypothetical protein
MHFILETPYINFLNKFQNIIYIEFKGMCTLYHLQNFFQSFDIYI